MEASGTIRPGAVALAAEAVDPGEPAPRLGRRWFRLAAEHGLELLLREFRLAGLGEALHEPVSDVHEQLDVERRVAKPRCGQRTGRPVGRRVFLRQPDVEELLDDRGETDPRHPEEACCELGVEDAVGVEADLAKAGQVLARRVQHPLLGMHGALQCREVGDLRRVEQERAGASAEHLDEVGTLRVTESARPLGIHRDGAFACGESNDRVVELVG
jgi:hypothetical protein